MNIRTIAALAGSAVLALSLSAPAAGQSGSETLRTPTGTPTSAASGTSAP